MSDKCPKCGDDTFARHEGELWKCHSCGHPMALEESHAFEASRLSKIITRDTINPLCRQLAEMTKHRDTCQADAERIFGLLEGCRRQFAEANERLDRLHDGGLNGPSLVDDSNAFWARIDEFRNNQSIPLTITEQRELAEWWAERGTAMSDLDEAVCERDGQLAEAKAENERLRERMIYYRQAAAAAEANHA